ncbi:DNA replication and repair protein RadC [Lysinibacillus fusiformis]|uniref:DNA replication and repair protein RadC n=2 Tax=Lysinibacillus fusiformis TaxID=28031 RepID=A0A1H9NJE0_9BACI|nr:DNA repair protein RadC [Lysinibacillus fusiformis]SCY68149.1 DNA replication and repair protein RadC [Lysinibacillus fusiformis]SEO10872.1 DNA replication and repair protein RadC [Lysinibacillus fusiformis]SER36011.1 DNA replication and repair protein RadC [Lysinibacillus fusiformis]
MLDKALPTLMLRDVHLEDRPRERLIRQGAESLSNQELLAILLRTGTKEESVLVLANRVLTVFERLHHLKHATIEEMVAIKGIGEVKAIQILASIELGRRLAQKQNDEKFTIRSPQDAAAYLMPDMTSLNQEHFVVLFLNIKNQIIHRQTIFIGSLNASIVHPREIFREAVKRSAASIICAHNHPSGVPTPSAEDIDVTKRIEEAGYIMGIELIDHVIIGDHQFISLKEKGYF